MREYAALASQGKQGKQEPTYDGKSRSYDPVKDFWRIVIIAENTLDVGRIGSCKPEGRILLVLKKNEGTPRGGSSGLSRALVLYNMGIVAAVGRRMRSIRGLYCLVPDRKCYCGITCIAFLDAFPANFGPRFRILSKHIPSPVYRRCQEQTWSMLFSCPCSRWNQVGAQTYTMNFPSAIFGLSPRGDFSHVGIGFLPAWVDRQIVACWSLQELYVADCQILFQHLLLSLELTKKSHPQSISRKHTSAVFCIQNKTSLSHGLKNATTIHLQLRLQP